MNKIYKIISKVLTGLPSLFGSYDSNKKEEAPNSSTLQQAVTYQKSDTPLTNTIEFQDLANRLKVDSNTLLDGFSRYRALRDEINQADLGGNREGYTRAVKEQENLIKGLLKNYGVIKRLYNPINLRLEFINLDQLLIEHRLSAMGETIKPVIKGTEEPVIKGTEEPVIKGTEEPVAYHDQTSQLAEKVLSLSESLFIGYRGIFNGAIYIGKDKIGIDRYAIIDGWKEEGGDGKSLEIGMYTNLDSKVKEEVGKYLLENKYKSAEEALNKTISRMIAFHDVGANGLKEHLNDIVFTRDEKGEYTQVNANELPENELKRVNEVYNSILETIEPVLKRELEKSEETYKKIEQKLEEESFARKQKEEETKPQRIETIMQDINTLNYR